MYFYLFCSVSWADGADSCSPNSLLIFLTNRSMITLLMLQSRVAFWDPCFPVTLRHSPNRPFYIYMNKAFYCSVQHIYLEGLQVHCNLHRNGLCISTGKRSEENIPNFEPICSSFDFQDNFFDWCSSNFVLGLCFLFICSSRTKWHLPLQQLSNNWQL